MAGPLDGLLVVSLEQAVAAPFCTMKLADAGARVVKIERAEGDFARGYDDVVNGESSYFVWLNRGKESVCLNIKDEEDLALMKRMLAKADVFVQNLAPGATRRAGLGFDELRSLNPALIVLDITGYGSSGPGKDMKAYDLLVQCESGLASVTGTPDAPGRVGISVSDIACGMTSHAAVLEALLSRSKDGAGRHLEVSLFDSVADWMTVPLLHQERGSGSPPRVGISHPSIAPYGAYPVRDGNDVVIAIQNEREWARFCSDILEDPTMVEDPKFSTNVARCRHREAMDEVIRNAFRSLSRAELLARLDAAGIAFASVNDLAGLSGHSQLRRTTVETPAGAAVLVAPPAIETGVETRLGPVPALGEHTDSVRREFA